VPWRNCREDFQFVATDMLAENVQYAHAPQIEYDQGRARDNGARRWHGYARISCGKEPDLPREMTASPVDTGDAARGILERCTARPDEQARPPKITEARRALS
jgi:hypothetical protein